MAIYHIGDLHLGHEKVAKIRGFENVSDHNRAIVNAWYEVVNPDDVVYVYGDLSSGRSEEERTALNILDALPGRKRLLTGNHDSESGIHIRPSKNHELFNAVFEKISDYGRIRVNNMDVLQSHYPYASQGDGPGRGPARYLEWRLPDNGLFLIHAHTHHTHPFTGSLSGREMCVSWDAWKRLVTEGDVAKWIKNWQSPMRNHGIDFVYAITDFDPPIYFDEPAQIEFPKE